jgi:hypothetical protein
MPVVRGHNYTVLTARIRKGRVPMDGQIAELEHLFKDEGWVFGTMWLSANSGPDGRSLTARRGGVLLAALTVGELAEKIRHEEAGAG